MLFRAKTPQALEHIEQPRIYTELVRVLERNDIEKSKRRQIAFSYLTSYTRSLNKRESDAELVEAIPLLHTWLDGCTFFGNTSTSAFDAALLVIIGMRKNIRHDSIARQYDLPNHVQRLGMLVNAFGIKDNRVRELVLLFLRLDKESYVVDRYRLHESIKPNLSHEDLTTFRDQILMSISSVPSTDEVETLLTIQGKIRA